MKTHLLRLKLVSLLTVMIIFSVGLNKLYAQVAPGDRQILIDLYKATNGTGWTNNWDTLQPVSTWYGVELASDQITAIRLDDNNLDGTIPASLGNLLSLQYLELDTNKISGSIPVEIGDLANLQQLYLSGNQLTGSIPTELRFLANLKWLNLRDNLLADTIPEELSQLAQLEYLQLGKNQLTGSIPSQLNQLSALKWLNLENNQLDGAIPTELGALLNLEQLYLNNNQLTGTIPTALGGLTGLVWLNLGQNLLTGSIPAELGALSNLELLYLDGNQLTTIPVELGLLTGLEWLNLSDNQFMGDIPTEIWDFTNLSLLYLNGNQFTGNVPSNLELLPRLKWLFLNSNQLTSIPDFTVDADSLMDLNVSNNQISFGDLEYNMDLIPGINFFYSPQDSIGESMKVSKAVGEPFSYTLVTGGTQNNYQWYKDGAILATQTTATLDIASIISGDFGVYNCEVTNTLVPGLTLTSRDITLSLEECQKLVCNVGWNIVSSPVMPDSKDMKTVFQPFIDNSSLIKIQDESGNTLEDLGIYGGWKNNIGDIGTSEGYKVKMSLKDSIEICGSQVSYPYDIPLKTGWNIIGYPQAEAYDGMDAIVQQLIDNGTLIKVQDESGNTIEDLGIYGDWKNTIGDFVPGKGYKIKVNANVTLTIYESYPKSSSIIEETASSTYFKPEHAGNGVDHMNIHVVNLFESGIIVGDEIGIFDGNSCVGGVKVKNLDNSFLSLIASAEDATSDVKDGFKHGNDIHLKLFRNGTEYPLELIPVNSASLQFEKNGSMIAKLGTDVSTATNVQDNIYGMEVYPNPFKNLLNIEISMPQQELLTIEIYDLLSRRVIQLYNGNAEGNIKLQWDGNDSEGKRVAPGVYVCRVNGLLKKVVLN